jgi:outer membrane protein OmpA-like peptidoglycan-associated protein
LKKAYAEEKARDKAAFDAELAKSQLDAAEKEKRAAEFQAAAAAKERDMNGKIAGLQGKLVNTQGELARTSGELAKTSGALSRTAGALAATESALAKAKEEMDVRRQVAREIKRGFSSAGIKADVDMQTGEVVLDFGNHYFENDSANLKHEMKEIIEKAMPVYSRSLLGNQKIANKISAVEIIGFASPTYKGRFVDPTSSRATDRAALKYNMDLSYRRANSIFNYLVEEKGPEFEYKHGLMALMKVSGRSFLEVMKVNGRKPATANEFCKLNDCKRAQRVIVRFSMDGRK